MLKVGIVGCGLQAATIAGYIGTYSNPYEVVAVADYDLESAKARMKEKNVHVSQDCKFYHDVDEFIAAKPELDGVIIGTFCGAHTETACKLEPLGVPLYIEKPVAISLEQIRTLYRTFKDSSTPIEVSLPMRLCPLTQRAKKIIDDGLLGTIYQIVGFEDTAGEIYFSTWFRDADKTGGMFMQKAVHDIDYMFYLAGSRPAEVCAMRAKIYYQGDKPYDLSCKDCPDAKTCMEGPLHNFRIQGRFESEDEAMKNRSYTISANKDIVRPRYCVFSKDISIEDVGECIIRMESGIHITHTQNFISKRRGAHRRGARLVGDLASLDIDFKNGTLKLYSHLTDSEEFYKVDPGNFSHYGGDRELVYDFVQTMMTGKRGRTDLIAGDGVMSTLACLTARESADKAQFLKTEL